MTCCLLALAVFLLAADEPVFRAEPLSGEAQQGQLVSVSGEKVELLVDGQVAPIQAGALRSLVAPNAPELVESKMQIELIDGSLLRADQFSVASGKARILSSSGSVLELSTKQIRWALLKPLDLSPELQRQWDEIRTSAAPADIVVFRRGEGKDAQLDQLEGVVYDVGEETVDFEFDGNRTAAKRAKIDAIVYLQAAANQWPAEVCQVVDIAGGRWRVQEIALKDAALQIKTLAGIEAKLPLDRVRQVDFAAVNIAYLSDLEWTDSKFTPYIPSRLKEAWFAPRRDEGFQGPLQIQGKRFEKGLALHSRTLLTYRLQDDYRRFRAVAGIDDAARNGSVEAHVVLTISGDGKTLFTSEVSGSMDPLELDLDLSGVKRLTILVDYGRDIDIADHLDLGEARLIK